MEITETYYGFELNFDDDDGMELKEMLCFEVGEPTKSPFDRSVTQIEQTKEQSQSPCNFLILFQWNKHMHI